MVIGQAVWAYRGFVFASVQREFQTRYRRSLFGALWAVISPMAMVFIYVVVFSQVMKAKLPGVDDGMAYGIYLCAGVLTWGFFSEVVTRCQTVFLENANLIKKVSFPRVCLPLIVVLNAGLNFGIVFSIFILFLVFSGHFPGWAFFSAFVLVVVQLLFAVGLGVLLGILNVFFRDVGQFFGIVLQFWFWFTPIVYPMSILPEFFQDLLQYNPMTILVQGYQQIFVMGAQPDWSATAKVAAVAVVLCLFAFKLFRKRVSEIVDEI